ncbi:MULTISPECIES: 6-phosphogluconolactonase [Pseudophaeobacter]|jgi:6-phosphogluconolactonase|uniref:6-phosphogluconolactonase n=1 Tax=Pseudophaeobacter TaxID=1541822 RepID=UPI00242CF061|nr:6-phosphogluconolactonase [Pseudophaeobacter profundi]
MNMNEYPDREILTIEVASEIAGNLRMHLSHNEWASIAVAGGTTPAPIFDDLCAANIDWDRVHVMATDERWVPVQHARSNARLIQERLLTDRAAAAQFLPFHMTDHAPEEALEAIMSRIQPDLPLSVVLLGMGEDMHTASLFPGVAGVKEALSAQAPALAILRPDSQPEPRISLSAPVLNGALSKHLVIFGEAKKDALKRALSLPPEEAPIQAVLSEMTVHWAP